MGRSLIAAAAAALVLAGCGAQAAPTTPSKVHGTVYVLNQDVLVDLAGGGYATITVGLQVDSGTETAESQTGVVREVLTNDLMGIDRRDLLDRERRDQLKLKLARDIRKHTDVKLDEVLLTDFTLH
ncbi:flagellar basal body-associated FliL family protein [Solirubrobacter soli]|uniref:flagellar basal body-associated FliL family protein n=1 Tax=Solirubrobacter soli TaxID=363832 RepID=UPI000424651D|nr:flagellar basal body-associated FliL family protein [Solirubrobacter soli]